MSKRPEGRTRLPFPREIGLKGAVARNRAEWFDYFHRYRQHSSCYTTMCSFAEMSEERPNRVQLASAIIDRAWWDLDSDIEQTAKEAENGNRASYEQMLLDAAELVSRLDGEVAACFTGRGIQIHQFFDEPVLGRGWGVQLQRYERSVAGGLESVDCIGHPSRRVRIPFTYNPKRRSWCFPLDLRVFTADPVGLTTPEAFGPEMRLNDPFLGPPIREGFDFKGWCLENPLPVVEPSAPLSGLGGDFKTIPLPPCIESACMTTNPPHPARHALANHLAHHLRWFADPRSLEEQEMKEIEERIVELLRSLKWRDWSESETRKNVAPILHERYSVSCGKLQSYGMCCMPKGCEYDDGTKVE